jgi:hypothetical protein
LFFEGVEFGAVIPDRVFEGPVEGVGVAFDEEGAGGEVDAFFGFLFGTWL